ncbi:MAG: acyl-ACP--UDP-N-acetylglucosamine O-acyltransferase [Candidatus Zixiibacteriota bacterium]
MSQIHPTAIIDPSAQIGSDVIIGAHAIIEADTKIGDNVSIGSNCLVGQYTELRNKVRLFHGAIVGTVPQDLKFSGERTRLVIGEETTVREYAMFNRGTLESGQTVIGKNCLLMAYTHIAHDCVVGDNVILGNGTQISGHVKIDDHAIISGLVPVHQFVHIGAHSMIGGGYRVPQDVCPYALVGGYPIKVAGINIVGLSRRGFSKESIRTIKNTFKILFFSNLNTTQAVKKIKDDLPITDEISTILNFIENSERGIVK